MAKEYTKQHIVPACYLANFGINGNEGRDSKIYYFINEKGKTGLGYVNDFPTENSFYDIPEFAEDPKSLELFFSKLEPEYAELLKKFINSIIFEKSERTNKIVTISNELRNGLSAQFALQLLRTNYYRNFLKSIYEQMTQGFPWVDFPKYEKQDFRRLHTSAFLSFDMAHYFANLFDDRKWIILVNHTEIPFFTSDNPIISINHSIEKNLPAASEKLTYYIPISPVYAIEMYQNTVKWGDLSYFDIYRPYSITSYNSHIKAKSTRMVFSNKDFNDIINIMKKYSIEKNE